MCITTFLFADDTQGLLAQEKIFQTFSQQWTEKVGTVAVNTLKTKYLPHVRQKHWYEWQILFFNNKDHFTPYTNLNLVSGLFKDSFKSSWNIIPYKIFFDEHLSFI